MIAEWKRKGGEPPPKNERPGISAELERLRELALWYLNVLDTRDTDRRHWANSDRTYDRRDLLAARLALDEALDDER